MTRILAVATAFLLFLLGLPLQAQNLLPERTTLIIRDTDLPGNDLRPIFDTTLADCNTACRLDPECTAFTFNSVNNTCFPKTAAGEGVAYSGALSGVLRDTPDMAQTLASRRLADLGFLTETDFSSALAQANTLGLVHYAGLFAPEDWRRSARNAFADGNIVGAMRRMGAAVTVEDRGADWADYAHYLLRIDPETHF